MHNHLVEPGVEGRKVTSQIGKRNVGLYKGYAHYVGLGKVYVIAT